MSKAFTKEDDGTGTTALPDLPQSPNPNYITPQGLAALRDRLAAAQEAEDALKSGEEAMDTGLAKAVQKRDLRFLTERIRRAIVVDPATQPRGIVAFGAEVDVLDEDGIVHTFNIVGEDEANPAQGRITPFSPLGRALIGGEVGSEAVWNRPKGRLTLEITAIRFS